MSRLAWERDRQRKIAALEEEWSELEHRILGIRLRLDELEEATYEDALMDQGFERAKEQREEA